MAQHPEILYATLTLPSLFAVTLISEGIGKLLKRQSGWVSLGMGLVMLGIIIGVFFGIINK